MRIPVILSVLFFFVVSGPFAHAQSLADLARNEEDRRKAVSATGKVYTNQDLKAVPAPLPDASAQESSDGTSPTATPADVSSDASADAQSSDARPTGATLADSNPASDTATGKDAEDEVKDEAHWRKRMEALSGQLDRDKLLSEAVQTRIDSLTSDFAGRDDPAQRSKIGVDRQKALAELERLKKVVAADAAALAAFEEEARRAGVPPGWLR